MRGGDCLTLEFTTGTFFVYVISNYCMCTVPLQFKKLGFEIRPIKGPPRTRGLSNWYYYNICTIFMIVLAFLQEEEEEKQQKNNEQPSE